MFIDEEKTDMQISTVVSGNGQGRIYTDDHVLLYEGCLYRGKPCGMGISYYPNGNIYQEGIFGIKGLLIGKEYFPTDRYVLRGSISFIRVTDRILRCMGQSMILKEAAIQVKCRFAAFDGCEMKSLRYAGDACNTEENIKWLNEMDEDNEYVQVVEFLSDFHVTEDAKTTFNPGQDYTDYQWWLARTEDGGWQLLTWGY